MECEKHIDEVYKHSIFVVQLNTKKAQFIRSCFIFPFEEQRKNPLGTLIELSNFGLFKGGAMHQEAGYSCCFKTIIASISTSAALGKAATPIAARAG